MSLFEEILKEDCITSEIVGIYVTDPGHYSQREDLLDLIDFTQSFSARHKNAFQLCVVTQSPLENQIESLLKTTPSVSFVKNKEFFENFSNNFNVKKLPRLVIVEKTSGKIINNNALEMVFDDPNGEEFPWKRRSFREILSSVELVYRDGRTTRSEEWLKHDVKLIYFSANWCPPCRSLTAELSSWYSQLKSNSVPTEILLVSYDRRPESFRRCLETVAWPALPFQCCAQRELARRCGIKGIPHLTAVKGDDSVLFHNAKPLLTDDPTGSRYPWRQEPVAELRPLLYELAADTTFLVALCRDRPDVVDEVCEALRPVADEYFNEDSDGRMMRFFFVRQNTESYRYMQQFLDADLADGQESCLCVVDGESGAVCRVSNPAESFRSITQELVRSVVGRFEAGTLAFRVAAGCPDLVPFKSS